MTRIQTFAFLLFSLFFWQQAGAQIFFTENFEGLTGSNGLPTNWTESGLSTDGIYYVGDSADADAGGYWPVPNHTLFAQSNDDLCDCDKSEDRLILPVQNFATRSGGVELIADLYMDGNYGSTGQIEISTDGGSSWAPIYVMTADSLWQNNITISLNAYANNSSVLIAFRYNDSGSWASGLGVDNVRLNQTASADELLISDILPAEYTIIPENQASAIPVSTTIANIGGNTAATINITTNVYDFAAPTTPIQTYSNTATNLTAGSTTTVSMGAFTPPTQSSYIFEHIITGPTGSTANDTARYGLTISNNEYARDAGSPTNLVGAGTGAVAIVGNLYDIRATTQLDSALFFLDLDDTYLGDTVRLVVVQTTAGVPNGTILGQSAPYAITAADTTSGGTIFVLPITNTTGGALSLTPGQYLVGVEESITMDGLGLLCDPNIYTPNTVFANINGGAFQPLNDLITAGFPYSPVIRPYLNTNCTVTATASATNATCTASDGSATATPANGAAPYTYLWSNAATTQTISGLAAGTYDVTITDASGCVATASATVNQTTVALTGTATATNATCGNANGSATATVSNGTAPYTYSWSNGATTATITGLMAGTYNVTFTDANGCEGTASATVNSPAGPSASTSATDATCTAANGSATVTATGGATPYTYLWSNNQTTATATALVAGTYNVTVTDNNGCAVTGSATVSSTTGTVSGTTSSINSSCGAANGSATVTATGGATPYSYNWSNGETTATASNLSAGTYTVTITDANGCQGTATATVSNPNAPTATAAVTSNYNGSELSCNGASDAEATVTPAGGTAPYTYIWSNGQTTAAATGLAAGNQTVTVTDNNGCAVSTIVTVTAPALVDATVDMTGTMDASCFSNNDGMATITASGGTPGYTYAWSNNANTAAINNIGAGTYTVTVTDANGCTDDATVTISQPTAIVNSMAVTDLTCSGSADGAITANTSGGSAPYTYNWSNGATTANLTALAAGTYTVTISDLNGCELVANATVNANVAITLDTTITGTSVVGASDGSIDLTVTGGTAPYTYSWSNGATTANVTNLVAGLYSVTVTDANGCNTSLTVNVPDGPVAVLATNANINISVFPNPVESVAKLTIELNKASDVKIELSNAAGQVIRSFQAKQVLNQQFDIDMSELPAGVYFLRVADQEASNSYRISKK
ncbi:T9SS type A sorting domain-containing protein [Saprospira sp. CCB-QB6]|uniref:T9SS type A sorting domain-containing protein n=1 Tax=Saprospira sp. CCB-QB6 TaxID=3023936 RepID=UPI00234AC1D0|nr:T9SS type A sorting domain-containing protein [Saprospira sp. CCB-QB6]WCL82105.1 T9SS type A sorting domain-containing protein [Saprospira sp. CCB-QB6]